MELMTTHYRASGQCAEASHTVTTTLVVGDSDAARQICFLFHHSAPSMDGMDLLQES